MAQADSCAAKTSDCAALDEWLGMHIAGYRGPAELHRFAGGQSNPTFRLDAANGSYVVRRKPPGTLLKGAHAIEREARVQAALYPIGFPVPRIEARCDDPAVIGSPFYVMQMIEGRLFWDSTFPGVIAQDRLAMFDSMNATIARLHAIDPETVGLSNYGRGEAYLARQVARWSRQYRDDEAVGRLPELDALAKWLPQQVPTQAATRIVHGDFRVDNLIFHPSEPQVVAVIDWELSTLGDPIADFAYHLMMYRLPPSFPGGLAGVDLAAAGLPGEDDYVAAYGRRTGRATIADLDYYLAYNLFRFAAIIHGIKGRALRGNAASADADAMIALLPVIAAIAGEQMEQAAGSGERR